mgnify:CR=1 FL=1
MNSVMLNEQKVIYLTNSLGEETNNKKIEEKAYDWYGRSCVDNDWLQYLVEKNGEIGMLAFQEISHPDCDDWQTDKDNYSLKWQQATCEEILIHLDNVTQLINNKIDFVAMLGEETGFMARHELCIWFPLSTNKTEITESFHAIKDIKILY